MSQSASRVEVMIEVGQIIATRERPITKIDRGTRAALGHTRGNCCSLTINYEEQEQANKVSGGTSV